MLTPSPFAFPNRQGSHLKQCGEVCGNFAIRNSPLSITKVRICELWAVSHPREVLAQLLCPRRAPRASLRTGIYRATGWLTLASSKFPPLAITQLGNSWSFFPKEQEQWCPSTWAIIQVNRLPRLQKIIAYPSFPTFFGQLMFPTGCTDTSTYHLHTILAR